MLDRIIARPVAVSLLMLGIALAGLLGFRLMPVSALPQVEFPTLSVTANLPGASPQVVASTLTAPLERALGSIAGITEITSSSSQGRSRISLQFALDRPIDAAARDVQAAINAALPLLPPGLPALPSYRKINPAEAPILIVAVSSEVLDRGQLYDAASTVLAQRLAQIPGVGQVDISGGALPAVRIAVNPDSLRASGMSLEQVRQRVAQFSTFRPVGQVESDETAWLLGIDDQLRTAADFARLILKTDAGRPVYLADVASVTDAVQDVRHYGEANGNPAIVLVIFKQPNANIIETVERIRSVLPVLQQQVDGNIDLAVTLDRTVTIRASLREVERTLFISVGLVFAVVLVFLRRLQWALIPGLCVPVTLLGACAFMYLAGFSLDNLSLMALIVVTGFVADDAIVVMENMARHRAHGLSMAHAARRGAREIAPTVLSISLALVAVFVPVLFMGGVVGRLFQSFALTLCVAVLLSMAVCLSLAPTAFAHLSQRPAPRRSMWGRRVARGYRKSLSWCLRHPVWTVLVLVAVLVANGVVYRQLPKGFFPQQDTGRISGNLQGDQTASFQFMQQKLKAVLAMLREDPAVAAVSGFTGGGQRNYGSLFMALKPLGERTESSEAVIARLRAKLATLTGIRVFLTPQQDVRLGGRPSNSQYEYSLRADDSRLLQGLEPPIKKALQKLPELVDVSSDQQTKALQLLLTVDRDRLAYHGLSVQQFDNHLQSAFGQRLIGTIYNPGNQYRVVLELAAPHLTGPEGLDAVWLPTESGGLVALRSLVQTELKPAALSVSHEGGSASLTFSFALAEGVALSQALEAVGDAVARVGLPAGVSASFQGNAKALSDGERSQPFLLLMTVLAVYLILGVLYESFLHPLTILSTVPAAGLGALLALQVAGREFTVIALVAVILLMGIVMKNAILMIDFALVRRRRAQQSAPAAILRAAHLRLRPILMTTAVALLGAAPLALMSGDGAELRQPLGIAVVGGLLISQLLTLYTTPVIFVMLERARARTAFVVAASGSALVLGACTNLTPPAIPAPVPQADRFRNAPEAWLVPDTGSTGVPAAWWTVYGDAQLNALQERVLEQNANLQAAAAQVQVAQAAFAASRAALFPGFGVNAGVLRSANNLTSPRGTAFTVSGVFSPWEVDIWGRLGALSSAADANRTVAAQRLAAARLSIHAQVAQTWLTFGFAQSQQALLENNEGIARRLLELAQNRIAAGVAAPVEVAQAQAQLSTLSAQRVAAQAQVRQLRNALVTLAGGREEGIPSEAAAPLATPQMPAVPAVLPSTLVARRPDILAAAAAAQATWSQREASRTALFPVLNLSASGGYRGIGFSRLVEMPVTVWSVGSTLAYPLFDAGARRAALAQADAQFAVQTATWRQTVLDALQEVEDQLVAVWQFHEQTAFQQQAAMAAQQALDMTRNQYDAGLVSLQTLLQSQQTALSARQALLLAQHQERLAANILFKNLAGLP